MKMKTEEKLNMTMLCDFYELTMGNGYFESGYKDHITYFDVFFRRVPDGGGFAIAAGLEQLIDYIENLHFSPEDIAYLRGRNLFSEEFLSYLEDFHFTGDIYAMPEGTPVFPREPMVIVRAKAIEAQLIETFTLLTINHQSLIATKANRIARAARGRTVLELSLIHIYGEGSIRKKPSGRWEGRYTQGIDPVTGRAIQKSVSAKTQAECKEKLAKAIRENRGVPLNHTGDYTAAEWCRLWFETYSKPNIRYNTAKGYEGIIEHHIIPAIGAIKLKQLSSIDVYKRQLFVLCDGLGGLAVDDGAKQDLPLQLGQLM